MNKKSGEGNEETDDIDGEGGAEGRLTEQLEINQGFAQYLWRRTNTAPKTTPLSV